MHLELYTDGACFGNPGPMGIGVVVNRGSNTVEEHAVPLGEGTNNVAELSAVRFGLERAHALGATEVTAHLDSEWSVKILKGEYKLRQEHLRPIYDKVKALEKHFSTITYQWIPREQNARADSLSKQALGRV